MTAPDAEALVPEPGVGGRLAHAHSTLGATQRAGILQTKAQQPHLTDGEIAGLFGVSVKAVRALIASVTSDMQPVLRSYAPEATELYWNAVQMAAAEGDYKGPQEFLRDAGAMPDRSKNAGGSGLNVTVIVSAPPGTPQYQPHAAPPVLVLEASAGPQLALTPLETKAEP
jgi:hypothetical protein